MAHALPRTARCEFFRLCRKRGPRYEQASTVLHHSCLYRYLLVMVRKTPPPLLDHRSRCLPTSSRQSGVGIFSFTCKQPLDRRLLIAIHSLHTLHQTCNRFGQSSMATACASCEQPLVVEIDADTEFDNNAPGPSASSPATVPDDLQTPCGCHFHW